MFQFRWMILVLVVSASSCVSGSESLPVDEIVQKANYTAYYQGKDGRADVVMQIKDAEGRERTREFTILRRDTQADPDKDEVFQGEQKFFIYFKRPADVSKTTYLVWKNLQGDDDRWLYLPALDLTRRIAAGDKRTSFAGSHFYYEDVSGRNVSADHHELIETTEHFYVLKSTPRKPEEVEFKSYKAWIHKQSFIPVKIEFTDANDTVYRVYEALKVETVEGYPTVIQSRMKDMATKGETLLSYHKVEYNLNIPGDIFTERYLRHVPRKYLK